MTRMKRIVGTVSALALTVGSTVLAAPGATDSSDEKTGVVSLEEIVVTAQKRQERLQDVPIAIAVMQGNLLDSSSSVSLFDALSNVPGVAITGSQNAGLQGGGAQLTIRGVTAGAPTLAGTSPIAYYLDGVPFGLVKSAVVPDLAPYDLDRVEVLRGPQGTLYGASAEDGVVRVITNDADLHNFDFKTRLSGGTTESGGGNFWIHRKTNSSEISNDRRSASDDRRCCQWPFRLSSQALANQGNYFNGRP